MDHSTVQIQIVRILSPHSIWVRIVNQTNEEELFQVGLVGLMPISNSRALLDSWYEQCTKIITNVAKEANRVYFLPSFKWKKSASPTVVAFDLFFGDIHFLINNERYVKLQELICSCTQSQKNMTLFIKCFSRSGPLTEKIISNYMTLKDYISRTSTTCPDSDVEILSQSTVQTVGNSGIEAVQSNSNSKDSNAVDPVIIYDSDTSIINIDDTDNTSEESVETIYMSS